MKEEEVKYMTAETVIGLSGFLIMILIILTTGLIAIKYWGPGGVLDKEEKQGK